MSARFFRFIMSHICFHSVALLHTLTIMSRENTTYSAFIYIICIFCVAKKNMKINEKKLDKGFYGDIL